MKEISCLRSELQQVRDDREHSLEQVQSLTQEVAKFKEITGKSSKDLDMITTKTIALEVCLHLSHNKSFVTRVQHLFCS